MCSLVYPIVVHSHFEHLLGVYWLTGEAIHQLKQYQGSRLDINKFDISCVKLARLLHDVGHGPFIHVFDGEFIPRVLLDIEQSHKKMSTKMVEYIVVEYNIDFHPGCIRKVKQMILASCDCKPKKALGEKQFPFDIVANGHRDSHFNSSLDIVERAFRRNFR